MKNIGAVIYVKSVPEEFDLRVTVRQTWGPEAKSLGFNVIFVFGKPKLQADLQKIENEAHDKGDILLFDYEDDYK